MAHNQRQVAMMTDLASLLEYCKLHPLEDAPRLILADYLEEQGEADRAEFVRLQLLGLDDARTWKPCDRLKQVQAWRLCKRHLQTWCGAQQRSHDWFTFESGEFSKPEHCATGTLTRGLLKLAGSCAQLERTLQYLPARALPWLEHLFFWNADDTQAARSLLAQPHTQLCTGLTLESYNYDSSPPLGYVDMLDHHRLRELNVILRAGAGHLCQQLAKTKHLRPHKFELSYPSDEPSSLAALLASPFLTDVRALRLSEQDSSHLTQLALARHVHGLEQLDFHGQNIAAADVQALCCSPVVQQLADLTIRSRSLGYEAIQGIAAATQLHKLRRLHLERCVLPSTRGETLAHSPAIERLQQLTLINCQIDAAGLRALLQSPWLGPLELLDLQGSHVGDAALQALAASPRLHSLRHLDLSRCSVTTAGLRALAESPHLAQLEYLDLSYNRFGPDALEALGASSQLRNLRGLRLQGLSVRSATLARLLTSPLFQRLQLLDLSQARLTRAHLLVLANTQALTALQELALSYRAPLPDGLAPLLQAAWLDQLVALSYDGAALDYTCIQQLTRTLCSGKLGLLRLGYSAIASSGVEALLEWPRLPELGALELMGNNRIRPELIDQLMMQVYCPQHTSEN